jgi:type IV pilus assembly protein PilE
MMNRERGFSLIEILTVIGVVAVLAVISIGSYRSYGLRTNRADGQTALLKISVAEEKYFLQNNTYTVDLADPPPVGLGIGNASPGGYYTLAVAAGATGNIATSYQSTATATGTQTSDLAACQVYTMDDQAQRTPADVTGCWK